MSACEHCWAEATERHAKGEGESVTEVYNRLLDEKWCSYQPPGTIDLMRALTHSLARPPESKEKP